MACQLFLGFKLFVVSTLFRTISHFLTFCQLFLGRDRFAEYTPDQNPFNYVEGSPINLIDPFGLSSERPGYHNYGFVTGLLQSEISNPGRYWNGPGDPAVTQNCIICPPLPVTGRNGDGVLDEVVVTGKKIARRNGGNWVSRFTVGFHARQGMTAPDISRFEHTNNFLTGVWTGTANSLFMVEGLVHWGALGIGRMGAAKTSSQILSWGNNAKGHLIKHADVLGFGGHTPQQLQKMLPQLRSAANQLYNNVNPALTRIGRWGGQADDVLMYITNNGKMLVTKQNGEFITVINKTSNNWYQLAKPFR